MSDSESPGIHVKHKKHTLPLHCRGCPYPSTGFLCGSSDGECMKTRMQKINTMMKKKEVTAND